MCGSEERFVNCSTACGDVTTCLPSMHQMMAFTTYMIKVKFFRKNARLTRVWLLLSRMKVFSAALRQEVERWCSRPRFESFMLQAHLHSEDVISE